MSLDASNVGNRTAERAAPPGTERFVPPDLTRHRTDAAVAVAWLIVANKPIFPLYVWWFVGTGTSASWLTALSAPAYLAVALHARRHPLASRVALPLIGALDTVFAAKLFGPASGVELFFVPCLLLAVVGFEPREGRWTKALLVVLFCAFVATHGCLGAAWGPWTPEDAGRLFEVVVFAVASLSIFVGWRFAGPGTPTSA